MKLVQAMASSMVRVLQRERLVAVRLSDLAVDGGTCMLMVGGSRTPFTGSSASVLEELGWLFGSEQGYGMGWTRKLK